MAQPEVLFDITELLRNPLRTGVQRVEREIIRHWPGPARLMPCIFDGSNGKFMSVSEAVFDILSSDAGSAGSAESDLLRPHLGNGQELSLDRLRACLFNPEVFYDSRRAAAYRAVCREPGANVSWLIHDFLPFLRPEFFLPGTSLECMHYLRALRDVPRVSFNSRATSIDYTTRIMRDPARGGPHFALGGDGLKMEKQHFNPGRTGFVSIGTIEPRKNILVMLEAFKLLWASGVDVQLTLIGRMESTAKREALAVQRFMDEKHFKYLGHADDETVRALLRKVRATIFISAAEGFGIPPFESLSLNVPVIVSSDLPSTDLLPPGGRIIVDKVTPEAVAACVKQCLDDGFASRLWEEASELEIPTWRDLAANIGAWVQAPQDALR
jgi:glycosyltransferase involved in cell wall biosynthesis